jgi:proline iminopeptidase
LIEDIEKIRKFFNIKKWCVEGYSWGATLGVLYAQKYPKSVKYLTLVGISLFDNIIEDITKINAPDPRRYLVH